jgi:hypothetical protein
MVVGGGLDEIDVEVEALGEVRGDVEGIEDVDANSPG